MMTMMLRVVLIVVSVITMTFMMRKIRQAKVQIEAAMFWVIMALILVVFAVVPGAADLCARLLGIYSTPNFLFLFMIFLLIVKAFGMTIQLSQLESKQRELIQKMALEQKFLEEKEAELEFAMVQVPAVLPRIISLPVTTDEDHNETRNVIFLEEIIERNMQQLFLNYDIVTSHPFRIMRNADFSLDEEEAVDLLEEIEKQLKRRQWGEVIRLEIEDKADQRLLKVLKRELEVNEEDIFEIPGALDLTVLMKMYGLDGYDHLKTPKYTPQPVPALMNDDDIFTNIRQGDILLMHPYETFDPVVDFVRSAAKDPEVLAIKQTLYRVSGNSPIIAALAAAAENGKQVSVLVELKARFDEENNIIWAKKLEKAGCHVIYGLVGLKTHSKITLVVRREEDGIRRYVHLGTGNYNDSTAKLYTDCGNRQREQEP
mgnify:CR=1 FL=1